MRGRLRAGLLLLALGFPACGGQEGRAGGEAVTAGSPAGLWTLDRERLLKSVQERYRAEGPGVVAREEAQARLVALDLQIREDGKFGLRTSALGLAQHIVGRWRSEGQSLHFFHETVDGKQVAKEVQEEATFEGDRIVLPFDATGLDFELIRK